MTCWPLPEPAWLSVCTQHHQLTTLHRALCIFHTLQLNTFIQSSDAAAGRLGERTDVLSSLLATTLAAQAALLQKAEEVQATQVRPACLYSTAHCMLLEEVQMTSCMRPLLLL